VTRFPNRDQFASWNGTVLIDASSGQHIRHRLSRAGNRRINHVLYMAGIVQLRNDTKGRRYYRRRLAGGKTPMEAMRCRVGSCPTWSTGSSPPTRQERTRAGRALRGRL
jgi:transposase